MSEDNHCKRKKMSLLARMLKRFFDVIGSFVALIVTSPAFIVIYIMIKHEDGGPAIFKQERIGQGGKPFTLYKFRSMVVKSESDGKPALCQKDDMRLTKVGKFIREHHLDELPQFCTGMKTK